MIVGVSVDSDEVATKEMFAKHGITWRNFKETFDHSPIFTAWRIHGFPAFFLIDATGKIRSKFLGSPGSADFDGVFGGEIECLLTEAKAAKTATDGSLKK